MFRAWCLGPGVWSLSVAVTDLLSTLDSTRSPRGIKKKPDPFPALSVAPNNARCSVRQKSVNRGEMTGIHT